MTIEVTDSSTIEEIREMFSRNFPFLSLEFFDEPHCWQETSSFSYLLPRSKKIGELRTLHNTGILEIMPWQKTAAVELAFAGIFGLYVQVFRLQGNQWIETAGTAGYTLQQQNEIGSNASGATAAACYC